MFCSNRARTAWLVIVGLALGGAPGANAQIVSEFGARYWYSTGQTDFDLYDSTGATLISRLTSWLRLT